MYKAIIFDLGGVIEKIDPAAVAKAFKKLGIANAENFFSLFKQSNTCSAFELGNITENKFIDVLALMCKPKTPEQHIINAWCANQLGISQKTVTTLNSLKKKQLKLFLLSNTNSIHANTIEDVFFKTYKKKLNSLFHGIYYSFEMHLRKPDKAAYRYLLDHAQLSPEQCVYIDDLEANLEVPNKLGLRCIHHKTNDEISSVDFISELIRNDFY